MNASSGTVKLWLASVCCGLLLGACGHAPEAHNARYMQAVEFSQRAQAAYQRSEYPAAIKLYTMALQLDRSIENTDGIAVNLLNLAKVSQVVGRFAEAHGYLDLLLGGENTLGFKPAHLAAAAVQKALLRLNENNIGEATGWVDKATGYCIADCQLNGVISNVRASIALHNNDADAALYWGKKGIAGNKTGNKEGNESGLQIEYANYLRLTAQACVMRNEFDAALLLLNEALAVDKTLGLPEKIRLDLVQLAGVYGGMGKPDLAGIFRERARRVGDGLMVDDKAGRK